MHLTSSVTKHSMEYYRMKTSTINGQYPRLSGVYRRGYLSLLALLTLLAAMTQPVRAETITIGKGTGILWEGMPFSGSLSGPMDHSLLRPESGYALLSISNSIRACIPSNNLVNIGGYKALRIAPGVGLIPRATGSVSYALYSGGTETLSGTIGLPETKGNTSSNFAVTSPAGYEWCLPPRMAAEYYFYSSSGERTANISGSWVLVADGSQVTSTAVITPMYLASFSSLGSGDRSTLILPSNITLRISTLECTVSTPTMVNFGNVERLAVAGTELATYPTSIMTSCSQASDRINANINLQFKALSGLYGSAPTRLSLAQGGGYITGEIDRVTGSGACDVTTGLPFDNTPLKIGNILSTESTKVISNKVIWRLCSGGSALPVGNVTASAEMLVTFN